MGKETSPPAPAGFSRRVRALWQVSLRSGFFRCRADFGPDGSRFFPVASDGAPACRACRYGAAATGRKGARRFSPFPNGLRRRLRSRCLSSRTKSTARTPERFPDGGRLCPVLGSLRNRAADGRRFAVGISDARPVPEHAPVSGKRKGAKDGRSGTEVGPAAGRSDTAGSGSSGCRRNVFGDGCGAGVRRWGGSVGWRLLNGGSVP